MSRGILTACVCIVLTSGVSAKYAPSWDSLDSRPLPAWYDEGKIGIFIVWGVYSVPSFGSEWFWYNWETLRSESYVQYMKENYRPGFKYQDFAPEFTAEFYNPFVWSEIFNASGANYIVLTTKHHDGYTLWPAKQSWNWNAVDVGPKLDLVKEMHDAIRVMAPHIHFGLYHSLFEWYNPKFLKDKSNHFQTNKFVKEKTMPELYDLVEKYKPEIIWSDGNGGAEDWYWNSTNFLSWLFNDSPVKDSVVVNDRWGAGVACKHGSFYTCSDRYNPKVLQKHKWENAMTLDKHSWGYRRNAPATDYLTINELLTVMAETISCGGNLLVNVGPTHDGMIPPIMEERLRQMGEWLSVNGEAIYSSKPWQVQNDTLTPGIWYTSKEDAAYAIVLSWPEDNRLTLGSVSVTGTSTFSLLGPCSGSPLPFNSGAAGVEISFPTNPRSCGKWVWVLKMTNVSARA